MQFKKHIIISFFILLSFTSIFLVDIKKANGAAYAFVQGQYEFRASGAGHVFTSDNTAGNTIIVAAIWDLSSVPAIADTLGNSYTLARMDTNGSPRSLAVWVAYNIAGGSNTVTLTLAGRSFDATYLEYSGLMSTDQVAGASGSGGTPSSGNTPTTTQAEEMVLGVVANNVSSPAAGSGFTSRANGAVNYFIRIEDKRVTSTGAYSGDFGSVSGSWTAIAVTFKEGVPLVGTLSCTMRTSTCSGGETEIFEMENTSNSHAGLPAASYNNLLCCSGVIGLGTSCSGTFATVLKLSGTTNAHVRQGTLADYASATNACISVPSGGDTLVGYQATDCTGFDTTLGSMIGTTNSHIGNGSWAAGTTKICASALGASGALTVDIVDSGGTPVTSPSIAMGATSLSFIYQTANGTFGASGEKVRVDNTTGNPLWTLTIAATSGPTALWSAGTPKYDFNDPTANAVDGADTDSYGGRMTIDASSSTLGGTCSATGITKGSSASFSEGATNSITLLTAGASAATGCYWDLTGVSVSQTIPAEQVANSYSINMMLTVVAN